MEFSELLKSYLDKSPYNHLQFARVCEIERSLLQKYLKGERKPKSTEQVLLLADKLMLKKEEREEFLEAYEILKFGKMLYYQRKAVKQVIELFGELRRNRIFETDLKQTEDIVWKDRIIVAAGYDNIKAYIQNLLYGVCAKKICELQIIMPKYTSEVFSFIKNICNKSNVTFKQILNLSQMRQESECHNVSILIEILPLIFGNCAYEAKYYYGEQTADLSSEIFMQNCILLDEYCLIFDRDLRNMIIYRDRKICELYQKRFCALWKKCGQIGKRIENLENLFHTVSPGNYLSIWGQSVKMYEFIQRRKDLSCTAIISREGCLEFLENGSLNKTAQEGDKTLSSKKERIDWIRKVCFDIRENRVKMKMAREEYLKIDREIVVIASLKKGVYLGAEKIGYIHIEELSIVNAFIDYFENYLTEEKVYSTEETAQKIEELM